MGSSCVNDEPEFLEDDPDPLLDLRSLMGVNISVGDLATAILEKGIQGHDRYGRFMTFAPNSDEAKIALNALATQWSWYKSSDRCNTVSPAEAAFAGGSPFTTMGWRMSACPAFQQEPGRNLVRKMNAKSEKASTAIIGGLMAFIRGELGNRPHPDWNGSDQKVKDLLIEQLKGYPGVGSTNLDTKFAEGNRMLREA